MEEPRGPSSTILQPWQQVEHTCEEHFSMLRGATTTGMLSVRSYNKATDLVMRKNIQRIKDNYKAPADEKYVRDGQGCRTKDVFLRHDEAALWIAACMFRLCTSPRLSHKAAVALICSDAGVPGPMDVAAEMDEDGEEDSESCVSDSSNSGDEALIEDAIEVDVVGQPVAKTVSRDDDPSDAVKVQEFQDHQQLEEAWAKEVLNGGQGEPPEGPAPADSTSDGLKNDPGDSNYGEALKVFFEKMKTIGSLDAFMQALHPVIYNSCSANRIVKHPNTIQTLAKVPRTWNDWQRLLAVKADLSATRHQVHVSRMDRWRLMSSSQLVGVYDRLPPHLQEASEKIFTPNEYRPFAVHSCQVPSTSSGVEAHEDITPCN